MCFREVLDCNRKLHVCDVNLKQLLYRDYSFKERTTIMSSTKAVLKQDHLLPISSLRAERNRSLAVDGTYTA